MFCIFRCSLGYSIIKERRSFVRLRRTQDAPALRAGAQTKKRPDIPGRFTIYWHYKRLMFGGIYTAKLSTALVIVFNRLLVCVTNVTQEYNVSYVPCQELFLLFLKMVKSPVNAYPPQTAFFSCRYLEISSVILKIGMNNEITIPPMTIPKKAITRGSIILVNAVAAASTCSS